MRVRWASCLMPWIVQSPQALMQLKGLVVRDCGNDHAGCGHARRWRRSMCRHRVFLARC